jgi:DNA-binding MarR family transcriptional regulator
LSTTIASPHPPRSVDTDVAARPRLSYLIKRVEQGSRSLIDEGLREFGVTLNQYTALSVLRTRAGLSSAELARRSFVTAQAMNQVVTALEQLKLLVREPDPAHRKILRAYLTPAGNRLLDRCDEVIDEAEATMVKDLSPTQLKGFLSGLAQCSKALDGMYRERAAEQDRP